VNALRELALAGLDLLATGQFAPLVGLYGYAMAFERDPVNAVRNDLGEALSDASGIALLPVSLSNVPIILYQNNASFLHAAIDCEVPTRGGRSVLVSFVVTGTRTEQFLTLEDIRAEPDAGAG